MAGAPPQETTRGVIEPSIWTSLFAVIDPRFDGVNPMASPGRLGPSGLAQRIFSVRSGQEDTDLMYLAREGLKAPLAEGWKPCSLEKIAKSPTGWLGD